MTNVPTCLNNLRTKVNDLDVGKLKTVPVDFKVLSDVAHNEYVKNRKFNKLVTKVNNLKKNFMQLLWLTSMNTAQINKIQKKFGDIDKKKYQVQMI